MTHFASPRVPLNTAGYTYGVFDVVAVDVWSDDSEVLKSLWWRRIRNVNDHPKVVSDGADSALEGARQALFGQSKVERQAMLSSLQDGDGRIFTALRSYERTITRISAVATIFIGRGFNIGETQWRRRKN